jgi:hypothetical protein
MATAPRCVVIAILGLIVAACATMPAAITPAAAPIARANLPSALLGAHNRERALIRVPPLAWDPMLAGAAAAYAGRLAAQGALRHSPREARPGQGENLWMGTRGGFSPAQMVANWAAEKRWFRPGLFPRVSSTGNWADVGHYSQMIWPTTRRLGCAIAVGPRADVLVCRYAPAGNIDGRRVP